MWNYQYKVLSTGVVGTPETTIEYPTWYRINGQDITIQFKIPPYLKDPKRHPLRRAAIESLYQFGVESDYFPKDPAHKEAIIKNIEASHFVELAINSIPTQLCSKKRDVMTQWIFLLFKFDDIVDNKNSIFYALPKNTQLVTDFVRISSNYLSRGTSDPADLQIFRETVAKKTAENIAQGKEDIEEWAQIEKLLTGLGMLHANLRKISSDNKFIRFFSESSKYFQTCITEIESSSLTNSVQYLEHRSKSGAVPTVLELAFELQDVKLENAFRDIRDTSFFNLMYYNVSMQVCTINEGVSAAKEEDSPEPNFLKLKRQDLEKSGLSREVAFTQAQKELEGLHDRYMKEYEKQKELLHNLIQTGKLHEFSQTTMESLETTSTPTKRVAYIAQLYESYKCVFQQCTEIFEALMASNVAYSKETDRYKFNPISITN